MYNKVSTGMNFVEREKEVEKFWKDKDIFRKSIKLREGAPSQVKEFVEDVVTPILDENKDLLGIKAEINC